DLQVRFSPDGRATSYREILSSNPPSLEFHRKIWQWLAEAMKQNRIRTGSPAR
ncbi:MAG: hypothetical protein HPY46_06955, partial [Candidatus Aminicenantes bacterium]|nr:hypothetical protein [Candidatus Aminicenantes bacterium]